MTSWAKIKKSLTTSQRDGSTGCMARLVLAADAYMEIHEQLTDRGASDAEFKCDVDVVQAMYMRSSLEMLHLL